MEDSFSDTAVLSQDTAKIPMTGNRSSGSTEYPGGLATLAPKPQERYRFIRSIGFGGMKSVLLVYDRDTDRELAMAMMPDFRERSRDEQEQFVREAKITARLEHPNIVSVHDIGVDRNGSPFYTMAYLRGVSLSVILKRLRKKEGFESGYYTMARRLRIFMRICNAVSFAHSKNICHLDIKPSNINIGEYGEVRLIDWGIACETDDDGRAKPFGDGRPKGTPGYMAPEQISTHPDAPPAGKSCDIYSLGALLYAFFALQAPFTGKSEEEALRKTMLEEPPSLQKNAAKGIKIPLELDYICRKAMAKDPADRYASVDELRHAIVNFQNHNFLFVSLRRRRRGFLIAETLLVLLAIFIILNRLLHLLPF